MEIDLDALFQDYQQHYSRKLRELLEDFEVVQGGLNNLALIERTGYNEEFKENVKTAGIAASMRLSSLDYAKEKYLKEFKTIDDEGREKDVSTAYTESYKSAKNYILDTINRLETEDKEPPTMGVFGAALVLQRLVYSFFSAHLLYKLGHAYEGHAVSRLILEQMAWSMKVYKFDDLDKIENISPSKSISTLKKTVPKAGWLYGFLSKKTHIAYESHHEFLKIQDELGVVIHGQSNFKDYAAILLKLADIFTIVWECSQHEYLDEVHSIE